MLYNITYMQNQKKSDSQKQNRVMVTRGLGEWGQWGHAGQTIQTYNVFKLGRSNVRLVITVNNTVLYT